jgi:hypothetical protein
MALLLLHVPLSCKQVVVATDASLEESKRIDEICHSHQPPIAFVRVETRGVFASVFCDFGPSFTVFDVDGEYLNTTWNACSSSHRGGAADPPPQDAYAAAVEGEAAVQCKVSRQQFEVAVEMSCLELGPTQTFVWNCLQRTVSNALVQHCSAAP